MVRCVQLWQGAWGLWSIVGLWCPLSLTCCTCSSYCEGCLAPVPTSSVHCALSSLPTICTWPLCLSPYLPSARFECACLGLLKHSMCPHIECRLLPLSWSDSDIIFLRRFNASTCCAGMMFRGILLFLCMRRRMPGRFSPALVSL